MSKEISTSTCKVCGVEFVPVDARQKARCKKIHELPCENCGNTFELKPNDKADRKTCSRKCAAGLKSKNVDTSKSCEVCGNVFNNSNPRVRGCSSNCTAALRKKALLKTTRNCKDCGEEFHPVNTMSFYCERTHYKPCEVCGNDFSYDPRSSGSKRRSCSTVCASTLINSDESWVKRKKTSMENYGVEYPFQAEEVKKKIVEHHVKEYGVKTPLASKELREKGKQTSIERYGHPWAMQNPEIRRKADETVRERYGVDNVSQIPEVKEKISKAIREGVESGRIKPRKISLLNREYAALIEEKLGVKVSFEVPLGSRQIDLGVNHILVDIHPTISHNSEIAFLCQTRGCSLPCDAHEPVARDYHYKRAVAAMEADRTLVQWYGWESPENLVEFLRGRVERGFKKYSARKLSLESVDSKTANKFFDEYHVQGAGRGQSHIYALKDGSEVVAVASFGKSRFGGSESWEFVRYAVKSGVIVHGGAGVLFKEFLKTVEPDSVVSYVDFSHTTKKDTFLTSLGFVEGKLTGPALTWHNVLEDRRVKQTSLLSVGADRLLGTNYGSREESGLDNTSIMLLEGYLPVWTAGNRVFKWTA